MLTDESQFIQNGVIEGDWSSHDVNISSEQPEFSNGLV
jgi:hypothetical protein